MRLPILVLAALIPGFAAAEDLRIAAFNASMYRDAEGALGEAIAAGDPQIGNVARIIRAVDPDVLLINEFDYGPGNAAAFVAAFLADAGYDHVFEAPSNTGAASGIDLNGDGQIGSESFAYANDAFGFGMFPGQYGMAVISKLPLAEDEIRTFQTFRWVDMPDARLPVNPDGRSYYSKAALEVFRLSSKSHWDVPVIVGDARLHLLASHPTPPIFDDEEDRNGLRNADEIRFWADYVSGADYFYDDAGETGGLPEGSHFVIAGDLNSDPFDGSSLPGAAQQLTEHPLVNTSITPGSDGAVAAAAAQGGNNAGQSGDPRFDTADFRDEGDNPGNLRVDYVLPSATLDLTDAGVFWPAEGEEGAEWLSASDHRLVWIDVTLP